MNSLSLTNFVFLLIEFRARGQSAPSIAAFAKARAAAARIFRIIDHKLSIGRTDESSRELDSVTGLVELRNVDFSYPSRPDVRVLNNFPLTVPAGKTVALVGSSGSVKSTVVSLIERFYDPISGNVFKFLFILPLHFFSRDHFLQSSNSDGYYIAVATIGGCCILINAPDSGGL